jgi:putative endonuclease
MGRARKDLGDRGETAALGYLQQQGYVLIAKNHRLRNGEIDLVLQGDGVLVFCEVKTSRHGFAWESYSAKQRKRMAAMVRSYLHRQGWSGPVRVDLLALDREPGSPHFRLEHFQDVLSVDDEWA